MAKMYPLVLLLIYLLVFAVCAVSPYDRSVWWAENHNSGIVYGDPLYSPTAAMLEYVNNADRVLDDVIPLHGSTLNGHDSSGVDTVFEVDYCIGSDFY